MRGRRTAMRAFRLEQDPVESDLRLTMRSLRASSIANRRKMKQLQALAKAEEEARLSAWDTSWGGAAGWGEARRLTAEYGKVEAARMAAAGAIKARITRDSEATCEVCANGDSSFINQIIICETCEIAVHQRCFGITVVPKGDWFCAPCAVQRVEDAAKAAAAAGTAAAAAAAAVAGGGGAAGGVKMGGTFGIFSKVVDVSEEKGETKETTAVAAGGAGVGVSVGVGGTAVPAANHLPQPRRERCVLCPMRGGALKPTTDGRWAHLTCALWGLVRVGERGW